MLRQPATAAGSILRAHRERQGIAANVAARRLGLHESQIHRAERGEDMEVSRFVGLCSLYRLRKGDIIDLLTEYKRAGA